MFAHLNETLLVEKHEKIYAPIQVSSGFVIGESESQLSEGTTRYSYKFSKTVPSLTVLWLSAITSTYWACSVERTGTMRIAGRTYTLDGRKYCFPPWNRTNYSWRNANATCPWEPPVSIREIRKSSIHNCRLKLMGTECHVRNNCNKAVTSRSVHK